MYDVQFPTPLHSPDFLLYLVHTPGLGYTISKTEVPFCLPIETHRLGSHYFGHQWDESSRTKALQGHELRFTPSIPGHCIDTPALLNTSGIFNTVTDFILVLLPVRAVWHMNMNFKKKVMVVLAFTFGLW
jgi:hypothetical protein